MKRVAVAVAAAAILLLQAGTARAEELKVLSAGIMQFALKDVGANYERITGIKLAITYDSAGNVKSKFEKGEKADVVILPKPDIDSLVKNRKIAAKSVRVIARTALAVAVRKGEPKPDISSAAAFKKALLAAKSIAYFDPKLGHANGILFARDLAKLGIAKQVAAKAKLWKGPQDLADEKSADLLVEWTPGLLTKAPDYEVVGPLPAEFQDPEHSTWAAGAASNASDAETAAALVQILATPESASVFKAKGMAPP